MDRRSKDVDIYISSYRNVPIGTIVRYAIYYWFFFVNYISLIKLIILGWKFVEFKEKYITPCNCNQTLNILIDFNWAVNLIIEPKAGKKPDSACD